MRWGGFRSFFIFGFRSILGLSYLIPNPFHLVACTNALVYSCTDGLVTVDPRSDTSVNDRIVQKVGHIVAYLFGSAQVQEGSIQMLFTAIAGAGNFAWQSTRARELISKLNVSGSQVPFDHNCRDTIVTPDGWTYDFVSRSWSKNRLADRRLRIIGRTRTELEDLDDGLVAAIASLWEAIQHFESTGGKSAQTEDSPAAAAVMAAFHVLMARGDSTFFHALFEICSDDLHLATYLLKQLTRALCGLSAVELLMLQGEKRSGKNTIVFYRTPG